LFKSILFALLDLCLIQGYSLLWVANFLNLKRSNMFWPSDFLGSLVQELEVFLFEVGDELMFADEAVSKFGG
jgi:hypothetical protein